MSHYQGYIVVQKMLYPESLNQYEPIHPELDAVVRDKALSVVRAMVQPFNPDSYKDVISERIAEAATEDFDPENFQPKERVESAGLDMASALDSFLQ
jgi:non-homologous end joining protein Ku